MKGEGTLPELDPVRVPLAGPRPSLLVLAVLLVVEGFNAGQIDEAGRGSKLRLICCFFCQALARFIGMARLGGFCNSTSTLKSSDRPAMKRLTCWFAQTSVARASDAWYCFWYLLPSSPEGLLLIDGPKRRLQNEGLP